jgi:hypothetical protein
MRVREALFDLCERFGGGRDAGMKKLLGFVET